MASNALGEAADIAARAASPLGLNLGSNAEPPVVRRDANGSVTEKVAKFRGVGHMKRNS
jgi:hypothetical protein